MAKKEYSLFQSSIQKVASSRPGVWFFSLTEHHFDKAVLKLTNNKATMTRILAGFPVVMLTSIMILMPMNYQVLCLVMKPV